MSSKPIIDPLDGDFRPAPTTEGFKKAIFGHPPSPKDNPYFNWAASYIPPKLAPLVPDDGTGLAPHDRAFMNEEVNRVVGNLKPDLGIGYADEVVDATPRNMRSGTELPSDLRKMPVKSSGLKKMAK